MENEKINYTEMNASKAFMQVADTAYLGQTFLPFEISEAVAIRLLGKETVNTLNSNERYTLRGEIATVFSELYDDTIEQLEQHDLDVEDVELPIDVDGEDFQINLAELTDEHIAAFLEDSCYFIPENIEEALDAARNTANRLQIFMIEEATRKANEMIQNAILAAKPAEQLDEMDALLRDLLDDNDEEDLF